MLNPNEPAFPKDPNRPYIEGMSPDGLSKREYFAALNQAAILSGIYANPNPQNILKRSMDDVAAEAKRHADTLVAELNK